MVESTKHFLLLREVFRSWWARGIAAFFLCVAFINGYAGLQDQFPSLPKLQELMPVAFVGFLPWWGWLLVSLFVLVVVFVYGLYDYVRRNVQPAFQAEDAKEDTFGPLLRALENRIVEVQDKQIEDGNRIGSVRSELYALMGELAPDAAASAAETVARLDEMRQEIATLKQALEEELSKVRLGVSSIGIQASRAEEAAKNQNLDIMSLLYWARSIETMLMIPLLIERCPKAESLSPPFDNAERVSVERALKGWLSEVSSVLHYMSGNADDVRGAVSNAHFAAQSRVRQMSPDDYPKGIAPLAFHDFYVVNEQCLEAQRKLLEVVEERRDRTLSTMDDLLKRYSARSTPRSH